MGASKRALLQVVFCCVLCAGVSLTVPWAVAQQPTGSATAAQVAKPGSELPFSSSSSVSELPDSPGATNAKFPPP